MFTILAIVFTAISILILIVLFFYKGDKNRSVRLLSITAIVTVAVAIIAFKLIYNVSDGTLKGYGAGLRHSITIPFDVTSINLSAINDEQTVTKITVGENVEEIELGAFSDFPNLKAVIVDENNKNYESHDGVLFNKEMTELFLFPHDSDIISYEIPSTVTHIDIIAFWDINNLKEIKLSEKITEIDNLSFNNCKKLRVVTLSPETVSIGSKNFYGCDSLKSITIPEKAKNLGDNLFLCEPTPGMTEYKVANDFVIFGKVGSKAQAYAKENNIKFVAE